MPDYGQGYRDGYAAGYRDAKSFRIETPEVPEIVKTKKKRTGKKDPKMASALKKANAMGRTKAGKLRKGYTQAKIMKKAHQLRRRM